MKRGLPEDMLDVLHATHYRPAVSVTIPFDSKIGSFTDLQKELKFVLDQLNRQLQQQYPAELVATVMERMHQLAEHVRLDANRKGVALFASPVFEKQVYLDVLVPARTVIDESFEIRDLVFSRKESHRYLLFLLSAERCRLFMGQNQQLLPVKLHVPATLDAYWHDEPQRVANFSDPEAYKSIQIEKLLRQMDKELVHILHAHHLPVFIAGSKSVLGMFRQLTRNANHIKGYIEGNYEDHSTAALVKLAEPAIHNWRKEEQQQLLRQLEEAASKNKLAMGIQDVWHEVYQKKGRLLVVEKDYVAAGEHISDGVIVYKPTGSDNNFSQSHDVVDDTIEMVLKNGGDVAFVDEGMLQSYDHIALIKFYT